jgi:NAD+ synthase (glutamine-hydrolysing)
METLLRVALAQLNLMVGDIDANTSQVINTAKHARDVLRAQVVVFPELTLIGYPPEDLLMRKEALHWRIDKALNRIKKETMGITVLLGYPAYENGVLYNRAGVIEGGKIVAEYDKQWLPNYQVFDEKRYFEAGTQACVVNLHGVPTAITICEDIWHEAPVAQAKAAGAKLMLNINASPFHINKYKQREALLCERAQLGQMPIVYVNLVGGQDELVFDGQSMVVDAKGRIKVVMPAFDTRLHAVDFGYTPSSGCESKTNLLAPIFSEEESIYRALVLGVRDYVLKNEFKGVVLGLSGGIDSALTLAIAVDALGADKVDAIMMPFHYTAAMSLEDAQLQAQTLNVNYKVLPIEKMYDAALATLSGEFKNTKQDKTEENIQARCRGMLLMAVSNKKGYLVLTTGNKSEMSVGYATLYGDMAGGFDVLKDVYKTWVYRLATYRNKMSAIIPERVITRAPSAELAPNQKDQDSLPPYEVLDSILELYIEHDLSVPEIIAHGFDVEVVKKVARLVDLNEYKRRQAPVGVRITQKGFGKDRRYPITSGWRLTE